MQEVRTASAVNDQGVWLHLLPEGSEGECSLAAPAREEWARGHRSVRWPVVPRVGERVIVVGYKAAPEVAGQVVAVEYLAVPSTPSPLDWVRVFVR